MWRNLPHGQRHQKGSLYFDFLSLYFMAQWVIFFFVWNSVFCLIIPLNRYICEKSPFRLKTPFSLFLCLSPLVTIVIWSNGITLCGGEGGPRSKQLRWRAIYSDLCIRNRSVKQVTTIMACLSSVLNLNIKTRYYIFNLFSLYICWDEQAQIHICRRIKKRVSCLLPQKAINKKELSFKLCPWGFSLSKKHY